MIPEARELDVISLHRYLSFLWCPGEGTPLKGVRKLLPGEAMIIREGKIKRKWIWYELPLFRGIKSDLDECIYIAPDRFQTRVSKPPGNLVITFIVPYDNGNAELRLHTSRQLVYRVLHSAITEQGNHG